MHIASLNNINFKSYNTNFEGNLVPTKDDLVTIMPFKARKLVKRMDQLIEDKWTEIRKANSGFSDLPYFTITGKKDSLATIKPFYQGYNKYILFEVTKGQNTERIMINRQNPDLFKYEKTVETEYGYATTRLFNSQYQKDENLIAHIGEYIEEFFPKVLPRQHVNP